MKILIVVGWVAFVVEALIVISFFIQPNVGDDAAGRGMATGFGLVLAPVLLGAGALFLWGQTGGPKLALWTGLGVISLPGAFLAYGAAQSKLRSIDYARGQAQFGQFDDPALTDVARAIDNADLAAVRRLIATGPIDFNARDRRGRTILGHAITRAIDSEFGGADRVEAVRALLAAGATPIENAIAPERTPGEPDGHLLLTRVLQGSGESALAVLDLLLEAGLSPSGVDSDGRPVIFSTGMTIPKLEILVRHGVDLQALDHRSDRDRWSALMNAAYMGQWSVASYFLAHGVSKDYVAPGGIGLEAVIQDQARFNPDFRDEPGYAEFARAVGRTDR